MSKKINICFIIPSLRAGGAERVMSFLAENINQDLFTSELLVVGFEEDKSYDITKIPVTFLNKHQVRKGFFSIYQHLRKNEVQIVISAISHLNMLMSIMAVFMPKVKFVGRETIVRTGTSSYKKQKNKPSLINRFWSNFQVFMLDAKIQTVLFIMPGHIIFHGTTRPGLVSNA